MLRFRFHAHNKYLPYPAKHISLRGVEEERYCVVDITKVHDGGNLRMLEEVEISRALFEIYEGGIVSSTMSSFCKSSSHILQFIHQGVTFMVNVMP